MEASKSTQKSLDKIFEELQSCGADESDEHKNVKHKSRSTNSTGRRGRPTSRPMEKMLKTTFARHWIEMQDVEKRQSKNIRGINHIMKKKSKAFFNKWQSELVESKQAVDELKKGTEKLKMELRKNRISKDSTSDKMSSLHQHFRNSDKHLTKLHRKNLREVYRRCVKTE